MKEGRVRILVDDELGIDKFVDEIGVELERKPETLASFSND
jgi:hypothetical protein